MWYWLNNIGGLLTIAVLLSGVMIGYWLLRGYVGDQAGGIIGLLVAAYPAYLVFRKF